MLFKKTLLPISSLFLAIALLATGYGMLMTFIGVFLKQDGLSESVIGLINAAFFLGAMLAAVFSQKLIVTVGHARSFSAFSAIMVIAFLGHALFYDPWFWALLRFVSGFAYYALLIVLESWLNEKSSTQDRGKVLAIYTIIFFLSTALGQLILTFDVEPVQVFILGSVLVLWSLFMIAITRITQPILKPFERYSMPKIYAIAPLALLGSFVGGVFVGAFYTMMPLFALNVTNQASVVAFFMALTILGGLVAQWPVGLLSDRFGRRRLLAWTGFFSVGVLVLLMLVSGLVTDSVYVLYLLGFLLGMSLFSIYPLSVARANDEMDESKDLVEISRTLLFSYGSGSFVAPLVLGVALGISTTLFFAVLALVALVLGIYSLMSERIPDDQMNVYVAVPATSADVLAEMDPRQDDEWVEEHRPDLVEATEDPVVSESEVEAAVSQSTTEQAPQLKA
ncbi:MFS transporter [Thiomicrospira cyclica]|uniref:Major facilitator superfamily MFS_1 n=1 Tax=Thiomicrospira cyclica (strain DSM 14477 / JCM 11371 / ALM1) TaxID=717773 RepID=F6D9I9_THICA|nr:MFS transporter [Thiomicrospira cyclica]AEG30946.1 major facilitator superfamily MFS_1 [Thiomicrospira cyclica ALM1]